MSTLTTAPATTLRATMTVRETSELLGISLRATYRLIEAGVIPVLRTGRRIHVLTHKLYAMLGIPLDQPAADPADEDDEDVTPASDRTSR